MIGTGPVGAHRLILNPAIARKQVKLLIENIEMVSHSINTPQREKIAAVSERIDLNGKEPLPHLPC